ncbi:MAG: hypothetical protein AAGD86_05635, partial [Pseudomonadota bacterium]
MVIALWGVAVAQDDPLQVPALDDFLGRADFWSPELSPSGRYLSAVRRVEEDIFLLIADLDDPDAQPQFIPMGNDYLNWVQWITDERLLLSATGYIDFRSGEWMTREDMKDLGRRQIPVPLTRVLSMQRDGSDVVVMFGNDKAMNRNSNLGRVVSFLPQDPEHILMPARL